MINNYSALDYDPVTGHITYANSWHVATVKDGLPHAVKSEFVEILDKLGGLDDMPERDEWERTNAALTEMSRRVRDLHEIIDDVLCGLEQIKADYERPLEEGETRLDMIGDTYDSLLNFDLRQAIKAHESYAETDWRYEPTDY